MTPPPELPTASVMADPAPLGGGISNLAIASLILGILSILFVFCCYLFSIPFGGIAVLLGWLELKSIREGKSAPSNRGMAKAGLIMGIVGICLFFLYIIFIILILGLQIGLSPELLKSLKTK